MSFRFALCIIGLLTIATGTDFGATVAVSPDIGTLDDDAAIFGPKYFINLTLKNGDTNLGTKKAKFDTGSNISLISRADAKMLGLLDNNDNPTDALSSGVGTGGKDAEGKVVVQHVASITLTAMVQGKDKDGKDVGDVVTTPEKKSVSYPLKGVNDTQNLLGTNIIKELPQEKRTPDGTISFEAPPSPNPKKKVDLEHFRMNVYDTATGLAVTDPLLANTNLLLRNAITASSTRALSANFFYVTGSPYTIISQSLASSLGLSPIRTFDLFNADAETFNGLALEGFLGSSDPGLLGVVILTSLQLPTESGDFLTFGNVPVLVNPFSSVTENIFGTNVFANANMTVFEDLAAGTVQVESVPEPASVVLAAGALAVFAIIRRWGVRKLSGL